MLARPEELWSNFWGALTHDGFYSRAHDYIQIAKNERRQVTVGIGFRLDA